MQALPNLKREDFTLTFESGGTTFLFEDLVASYYMAPVGESVSIWRGSKRVFMPNTSLVAFRAEALNRTVEETKRTIAALSALMEEMLPRVPALRAKSALTKQEVEAVFKDLGSTCGLYVYFDPWYWDSVYERATQDPEAAQNVALVQGYKNVVRAQFEPLCFEQDAYLPSLVRILSNQFGIPKADLEWFGESEVLDLFEGKRPSAEALAARRLAYVDYVDPHSVVHLIAGDEAQKFAEGFDKLAAVATALKGMVANKSHKKIEARARVILRNYGDKEATQRQMDAMIQGEILVSDSTDPELIPAFKKAVAVVTDMGGLLSHAAITSREMNLPCVVGTGNASKILKTGDLVEVDAEKGVVTILERA